ncbi:polysaccharide pyruvyl transferase family protein [Flagellimonas crocea]|uniref:polysaccharide pyruvyl transferase family protein n=1 Tax=Flagellimonas crocea TaxID=3067311 RepID=UPI00296EB7C9|nr:polysaccharide pyruvyl transferase family protein [Muricauda sp. DH64]
MGNRKIVKVGILTLPLKGNYGGVLQAYALLTFLKKKGYNAFLVDRQWDIRKKKTISYWIQKFFFHHFLIKNVKRFSDRWIVPRTNKIDSQSEMINLNKDNFDAFIVGSDQVWRVEHTGGVKNNFFLDFVEDPNVKRISYAPSFGKDSVDVKEKERKTISKLLKKFTAISVRESSGIDICKNQFDVDAIQVVDPTLLLSAKEYLPIIESKINRSQTKVLTTYVLDNSFEKNEKIQEIANVLGLKVKSINYKKNPSLLLKKPSLDIYNYVYPSVSNWLRGFQEADFVVTDSFHGTLFSIIFRKQFIVIGNEKRGMARFQSILSMLELEDRLITSSDKSYIDLLDKPIDYSKTEKILSKEIAKSSDFLLNALE